MKLAINSSVELNNKVQMPLLGLGVWKIPGGKQTETAVRAALDYGYRMIDTAQQYGNEASVGKAIRESGVSREQIFVTSKLAIGNFGYDRALASFEESLSRMGLEYLDLFLLHFPVNSLWEESWRALEKIYQSGRCKAIGVSNFTVGHLSELLGKYEIIPAVNQVEFSPFLYQKKLLDFCVRNKIQLEAYSPLTKGKMFWHPAIQKYAQKYQKSPAQILIRWALEHEVVVIPKSEKPERIQANADIFDFELTSSDLEQLDNLNQNLRWSWNPESTIQRMMFSSWFGRQAGEWSRKSKTIN